MSEDLRCIKNMRPTDIRDQLLGALLQLATEPSARIRELWEIYRAIQHELLQAAKP